MGLFPLPQVAPSQAGLFDNIRNVLGNPAVKAGLLQAGMSMLNANPGQSPFAQVFSGIGEGIAANQRYKDLVTQQEIDRIKLADEQKRQDMKDTLAAKLADAKIRQAETAIQTSQANSKSLGMLRGAQAERAKKFGLGGRSTGSLSPWQRFYSKKIDQLYSAPVTPELVDSWKQEFSILEQTSPGASGTAKEAAAASASAGVASPDSAMLAQAQQLADEEGVTLEEALAALEAAATE